MTQVLSETKMGELSRESGLILKSCRTPECSPFHFPLSIPAPDPADQRVLLAREGSWKLQRVPGLSLFHGPGLQPGSSPHLRAALQRVPRADEGEGRGPEQANSGPSRSGAATLNSLSMSSLRPQ